MINFMTTINSGNFGIFKDLDGMYFIASNNEDEPSVFRYLKTDNSPNDAFMAYNLSELIELRDLINRLIDDECI
jgi:hypothetical protein